MTRRADTAAPGRVAVVIGGSRGIGRAVATRLVEHGDRVIVVARTMGEVADTCAELDPSGINVIGLCADVTELDTATRIESASTAAFGELPKVIVASSGLFVGGSLASTSGSELQALFDVNALAPIRLVLTLLEAGGDASDRHVVFVNSSAGLVLNRTSAGYSAAKIALRSLADALRADVNDRGVRVTSIFPGRTDTAMLRDVLAAEGRPDDAALALRPDDVAAAVMAALSTSPYAEITEIAIRPMRAAR